MIRPGHLYFLCNQLVICLLLHGCTPSSSATKNKPTGSPSASLTIAVAANMQYAFEALADSFRILEAVTIIPIVSSSGKLAAQIQQGAPFDLFLSADMEYPGVLFEKGHAAGAPKVYALGALVLWSLDRRLIDRPLFDILKEKSIKKIALANPHHAPYGAATLSWIQSTGLMEILQDKLVFGESIAQTTQFIQTGACEIGFTAKSLVLSESLNSVGTWKEIPANEYPAIEQGAIITSYGARHHPAQAAAFMNFLESATAKTILSKFGYSTTPDVE